MEKPDTSRRTDDPEIMDDFDLKGPELEKTLSDLDNINKWLGGNKVTIQGVKKLLKDSEGNKEKVVKIVDVGCGNGALLREIARWGRSKQYKLELIGIDANKYAIQLAEKQSAFYPEIKFKAYNIFSEVFRKQQYDIILCTLTLHHFKDAEIKDIMNSFFNQARIGIVINDLHRSKKAYYLFKAFCKFFIRNEIARKDGLTSILRGFKKEDLKKFAADIPAKHQQIKWKWAYRYQWVIEKEIAK